MEELKAFLTANFPTVDFDCTELISGGMLDSITLVSLISLLEDKYDVEITMDYIVPENFESVKAIWNLIDELS